MPIRHIFAELEQFWHLKRHTKHTGLSFERSYGFFRSVAEIHAYWEEKPLGDKIAFANDSMTIQVGYILVSKAMSPVALECLSECIHALCLREG